MPFNSKTASTAGKLGGKATAKLWAEKDPKEKRKNGVQLKITITTEEKAEIDEKARAKEMSITELIVKAVRKFK